LQLVLAWPGYGPSANWPTFHPPRLQYDEPVGKNDGSVKGKRYFDCPQGYGAFVRPNLVKTGDYPPFDEDLFGDDDEI